MGGALLEVSVHPDMILNVAKMQNSNNQPTNLVGQHYKL